MASLDESRLSLKFAKFGLGTRLGSDVPQTRHERNTSPKRSIRCGLWDGLGDATGDALKTKSLLQSR